MPARSKSSPKDSTANPGFEEKLWLTADKLRNNMDAAEPSGARKNANGSPQGELEGVHQFSPPSCVVRCLVEMLAPYKGRFFDPACGSSGSLPVSRLCGVPFAEKVRANAQGVVQSEKSVESPGGTAQRDSATLQSEATLPGLKGNRGDISIYGQDKWARRQQPKLSNAATRRLAVMNLALRGIEAEVGPEHADTFRRDLRADYVPANQASTWTSPGSSFPRAVI